jgi:hypothetical protein
LCIVLKNIASDNTKLCARAHVCKGQFKEFLFYSLQVQCVFSLLPCAHRGDIRLHAKHSAPKDVQSLHSLFVFGPSSCSGLQALVEGKHRLPQSLTRSSREVSHLEMADDRKRKLSAETNRSGNCSRML